MQVVAVGSGKADEKGNVVKSSLSVGDTVLYSKYSGVEFEVGFLLSGQGNINYTRVCKLSQEISQYRQGLSANTA